MRLGEVEGGLQHEREGGLAAGGASRPGEREPRKWASVVVLAWERAHARPSCCLGEVSPTSCRARRARSIAAGGRTAKRFRRLVSLEVCAVRALPIPGHGPSRPGGRVARACSCAKPSEGHRDGVASGLGAGCVHGETSRMCSSVDLCNHAYRPGVPQLVS